MTTTDATDTTDTDTTCTTCDEPATCRILTTYPRRDRMVVHLYFGWDRSYKGKALPYCTEHGAMLATDLVETLSAGRVPLLPRRHLRSVPPPMP